MGYPVPGYRSNAAREMSQGGFQRPEAKPYRLPKPGGSANDNSPPPANDNGFRPPKRASIPRGLTLKVVQMFGSPVGAIQNTIFDQWAGLSRDGQAAPELQKNTFYGGLPLAQFCKAGGPSSFANVSKLFFKQCLTGQAVTPNGGANLLAGQYLRVYNTYKIAPSGAYRGDVLAAYGPAPRSMNIRVPTFRPSTHTFVWPFTPKPFLGNLPNPNVIRGPKPEPTPYAPPPMTPRRPPGPGEKENKLKSNRTLVKVMGLLNAGTEGIDLMDAFYDALPDQYKAKFKKGMNKGQQEIAKAKALYRHWDKVDLDTAIFNALFSNLVEDRVYALLGLPTKPLGRSYGTNMGVNKLFSPLVSGAKPLLDSAKQFSAGSLNNLGFTIK